MFKTLPSLFGLSALILSFHNFMTKRFIYEYVGSALCNSLPEGLREHDFLLVFKHRLKSDLLLRRVNN